MTRLHRIFHNMRLVPIDMDMARTIQGSNRSFEVAGNGANQFRTTWNIMQTQILFGQRVQVGSPLIGKCAGILIGQFQNLAQQRHHILGQLALVDL